MSSKLLSHDDIGVCILAYKRLDKLRINQDINWLYSCILKDFGDKGLERIKRNVSYKNSPFSKLKELKSKFNF